MRCFIPLALAAITLQVAAAEPVPAVTLPSTEQRSITSRAIGQQYDLLVQLPDDYATSGKSYPVLYVLDGWHFPFMAFLAEKVRTLSFPAGLYWVYAEN